MYMVIFRTGEGKPGFHQAESLDDAVRFVERLRNQEQVTDASVFRMSEVPLEFKTYIKVEVADAAVAEEAAPSAAESGSVAEAPAGAEPLTAAGSSPARFGRFRA
ncbi:MAG: hypothetical protein E6G27_16755 [Actinobacteria bacterium]|nr:MAG: hypothetical protein E6G27_16755 [Actinomycetota bacterium]